MTTRSYPLVTVGIPTYNRADTYLKQALESALNQTYPSVEIVLSDNCSTDKTQALVESFSPSLIIRYFRQIKTISPNDNFNFCLHQAQGDYFLLLHDDDNIDSDFIDTCMRATGYNTDIGIIRTGTRIVDSYGIVIDHAPNRALGLSTADFFLAWFAHKTSLFLCSTLFNTRKLIAIGGFRSRHNLFQDVLAEIRLASQYGRVDIEDMKASFRRHAGEITFAAKVSSWCEDSLDLLDVMCELALEKQDLVRRKGTRFFADRNYNKAAAITSLTERLSAYFLVMRTFGYRYPPTLDLIVRSLVPRDSVLYSSLRYAKRKVQTALRGTA